MGRGRGKRRQTALLTTSKRRETGSFTPGKDSSNSGAELRVSPSHNWTGQARGEPGEFPKAHERQVREGKKSSLLGLMPGELLKRGLRVGGGVSLPLSRNGREEGATPKTPQRERDIGSRDGDTHGGSGAAALLGARARTGSAPLPPAVSPASTSAFQRLRIRISISDPPLNTSGD